MVEETGQDAQPDAVAVLSTAVGDMSFEDGVAVLKITPAEVTPENIRDHLAFILELSEQTGVVAMPVLIDLGAVEWIGWEARICASEMLRPEWNTKIAFLYRSPTQRVLSSFFANINKLQMPWIISGDRSAAIEWLRSDSDEAPVIEDALDTGDRSGAAADMIYRMILGETVSRPRMSGENDELDAVLFGLAMIAEDMRELFERGDRVALEAKKHRSELEGLVRERTDELKNVNEALKREIEIRKLAEEELRRINAELEAFASTVSHDIKAPLAITMVGCETLQKLIARNDLDIPELDSVSELIIRNSARANRLIDDMLSLAQVGQEPISASEIDVGEVLVRVLDDSAEMVTGRNAVIEVDSEMGTLRANPTHLYQLFSNLIRNAVEHNPADAPRVVVSFLGSGRSGNRYKVRDNGPGIPETDSDMVFWPFYAAKEGRTGLGLATVQKIIKIYGGHIKAYNDGGACFEFTLRSLGE
jgi:signal transduction histidine kinase